MKTELAEQLVRMYEQGRVLQQQGRLAEARGIFLRIIEQDPTHFDALNLLGVLAGQARNFEQAVKYFDAAISVAPDNPAPYCNRGLALKEMNHPDAALASFSRAIALKSGDAIAYYCRANIYSELGQPGQALGDYDRCVAIDPGFAHCHFNRAALLHRLGRLEAAVSSYELAIAIQPNPAAYLLLGNALKDLDRRGEALDCYELAIELKPDYAEAYANLGVVYYELGNIEKSLSSYDRAVGIKSDYAEAYFNRGSVLRSIQRFEPAVADFDKAAALQPDIKFLPGALIEAKLQICDWHDIDAGVERVKTGVERGDPTSHPFALLTFSGDSRLQRQAAEIFVRETCPADDSLGAIPKRSAAVKIRIGYFSGDFREHPVPRLLAQLIDTHDRSQFDVVAFSFGPDTQDPMRKRLEKSFDRFIDVRGNSDREIALLARSSNIDIAVDLAGYTGGSRTRIFALRAAPIQINYLGYPGTMGSGYMDYVVADDALIPDDDQRHYSEKVIYLPTFQANDSKRNISDRVFSRAELGLPSSAFIFCCFNTSYKIMPCIFDSWMRILTRVPGSVLFLDAKTGTIESNLREAARRRGIAPDRLVFGKPLTLPDWLARHRVADLFLDTLPYNAGTTASDALWTGLPVLTRVGTSFTGRMAASLLRAIDLQELITWSAEQYEDLAVELATNPRRLADIKQRLVHNRLTKPLFDQSLFTKKLESAYRSIHERYMSDLPPDHIRVI
jgi:predicted O-linked N-acetylglucosamine transferase (SPINDLY family)